MKEAAMATDGGNAGRMPHSMPDRGQEARSTACVCGEINTRHCPVHGQGEPAASPSRMVRVLLWLAAPAKISRFYLGMIFLAWALAMVGWIVSR